MSKLKQHEDEEFFFFSIVLQVRINKIEMDIKKHDVHLFLFRTFK